MCTALAGQRGLARGEKPSPWRAISMSWPWTPSSGFSAGKFPSIGPLTICFSLPSARRDRQDADGRHSAAADRRREGNRAAGADDGKVAAAANTAHSAPSGRATISHA